MVKRCEAVRRDRMRCVVPAWSETSALGKIVTTDAALFPWFWMVGCALGCANCSPHVLRATAALGTKNTQAAHTPEMRAKNNANRAEPGSIPRWFVMTRRITPTIKKIPAVQAQTHHSPKTD